MRLNNGNINMVLPTYKKLSFITSFQKTTIFRSLFMLPFLKKYFKNNLFFIDFLFVLNYNVKG